MRKTESLDQICQSGACAPNQTSKLQNKSKFRGSILEELMKFALSSPISAGRTRGTSATVWLTS